MDTVVADVAGRDALAAPVKHDARPSRRLPSGTNEVSESAGVEHLHVALASADLAVSVRSLAMSSLCGQSTQTGSRSTSSAARCRRRRIPPNRATGGVCSSARLAWTSSPRRRAFASRFCGIGGHYALRRPVELAPHQPAPIPPYISMRMAYIPSESTPCHTKQGRVDAALTTVSQERDNRGQALADLRATDGPARCRQRTPHCDGPSPPPGPPPLGEVPQNRR